MRDLTKFLRGRDGTTKSVRYISVSRSDYHLERKGTGIYDIMASDRSKVAERRDINISNLGELRTIRITDPSLGPANYGKEFATLHLTREQKAQFRQNPQSYVNQLNQELASRGYTYRAEYKMVNQRDLRTGQIKQVPKLILSPLNAPLSLY